MNFPDALKECFNGKLITNKKWNGKGMYCFMMPGYINGVPANETLAHAAMIKEGENVKILPYLMMKNAKGEFVPWVISNMDVFSDRWAVIE